MAKYFINGQSTGGSLAVEKHLNRYFHEAYYHTLIEEGQMAFLAEDLAREQAEYFKEHRGNAVNIGTTPSWDGDMIFVNIGSLSYTCNKVRESKIK